MNRRIPDPPLGFQAPASAAVTRPDHPPGAAAPEGASADSIHALIDRIQKRVERFRIDIERYFNGALPFPPEELRNQIHHDFRLAQDGTMRSAADQFRLSGLEARFNTLSELFGRRLREREEGRGAVTPTPPPTRQRLEYDPRAGIVLGAQPDDDAVEALWGGLATAGAGAKFELDTFRTYIARQVMQIRTKTGSEAVLFRVVQEEGKLKLKAKPLAGGSS